MEEVQLFKNITILSLEQATVLPYLTLRLAEEGANVIRMEHPIYGDPNRRVGDDVLKEDRMFSYYLSINAGKKALTLDIGAPEGHEILKELITKLNVDIFVTNQLPRNYTKLGIEYEMLRKIKGDIIWLGMTGFGPQSNDAVERLVIFGAAVRISRAVLRHRPDEDLPCTQHLAPRNRDGEEMGVPERHVACGDSLALQVGAFDGQPRVSKAGAANLPQVLQPAYQPMLGTIEVRQSVERLKLTLLRALPVSHVQHRQAIVQMRNARGHATVHAPAGKNHRQRLVRCPWFVVRGHWLFIGSSFQAFSSQLSAVSKLSPKTH